MSMKNSSDTVGNRFRHLPVCSTVPQLPRYCVPPILQFYPLKMYVILVSPMHGTCPTLLILLDFMTLMIFIGWSQCPRGLRRRFTAARLLRSLVRIPPGAWGFVCCVCCVLSGRGLCDGLITRPDESYRLWRVVVCDYETSRTKRP
jgi:hypothetical protein